MIGASCIPVFQMCNVLSLVFLAPGSTGRRSGSIVIVSQEQSACYIKRMIGIVDSLLTFFLMFFKTPTSDTGAAVVVPKLQISERF